jgi:hypothetical protein
MSLEKIIALTTTLTLNPTPTPNNITKRIDISLPPTSTTTQTKSIEPILGVVINKIHPHTYIIRQRKNDKFYTYKIQVPESTQNLPNGSTSIFFLEKTQKYTYKAKRVTPMFVNYPTTIKQ